MRTILFFLLAASYAHADCERIRGAFDIGSRSTKLKVAKVDACTQKILKELHQAEVAVPYKEALLASAEGNFDGAIVDRGLSALKTLLESAKPHAAQEFSAVATSAFREAKNGIATAEILSARTRIPVRIILPKEEGELGFSGVLGITGADPLLTAVWDIGGGSQQITIRSAEGLLTSSNQLGSIAFKDFVVKEIEKKTEGESPNPLAGSDADRAVALARETGQLVDNRILERLRSKGVKLYGIGGTHKSVVNQIDDGSRYTLSQLRETFEAREGLTDEEIGGKYAPTEISNLALVLGMMWALDADAVRTLDVNLTDGLLPHPDYWPRR